MSKLSVGLDVELFLTEGGNYISAIGKIGGSKKDPRPLGDGFYVQEDNVLVEFNTPPAESEDDFVIFCNEAIERVKAVIPTATELRNTTTGFFPYEALSDPKACEFGCEPDYNAYTRGINPRPSLPDIPVRCAGAHVHVGYENHNKRSNYLLIRALDVYAGLPSVIHDPDTLRRTMYGRAGACRHKKAYGVEYRTLSPYWVMDETRQRHTYKAVLSAVRAVNDGTIDRIMERGKDIEDAINTSDATKAMKLIEEFKVAV